MSSGTIDQGSSLKLDINYKSIIKIALPISLAMLVPQLNFVINNIFLGRLGETELAIAGITGVYYLIFGSVGYALNNGLQALFARRAGSSQANAISSIFLQGTYVAFFIAAIAFLCTYLVMPPIFHWILKDPELSDKAISFLKIRIWGLPFLYLFQIRNALFVGINQSKWLIWGTTAETVINIIFDYALIYGKFGLPELGFNGAAYASILAEFSGFLMLHIVMIRKDIQKNFRIKNFGRFEKATTFIVLSISAPLIFQHAISIITWEYFYILIARNNSVAELAASNTMRNMFGVFGVISWAFAATCNTMVSNIIGQGRQDEVFRIPVMIARMSFGVITVLVLFLNLFPEFILSIYGQDAQFMEVAIPILRVVTLAIWAMSIGTVWLFSVTGTGNSKVNLLIEVIAVIFYVVFSYIVLEKMQLPAYIGWSVEWGYWLIMCGCSYWYMKSGRWKNKVI
ncbi:MATE family efflux transporter [Gynurincola endophyticus]|jgi:MATE family multidrug resistance protein|uniref:MATE family efflux transporter n=1 Tax=Gynurincola endophyticus TaxID=2479004 RepID=UPI000F8E78EF|nr:MATE family efflux transporter [Gynurincola endophyticus]